MRKINWKAVVKIACIILLVVGVINPFSTYLFSQFLGNKVIKPTLLLNDKNNPVLKELQVVDWCDPLPCHNTYIVITTKSRLAEDFVYCDYANISGNIHIVDDVVGANPLPNFGSNKYCGSIYQSKYTCLKDNILTKYSIYRIFPYPRKTDLDYYSCVQKPPVL